MGEPSSSRLQWLPPSSSPYSSSFPPPSSSSPLTRFPLPCSTSSLASPRSSAATPFARLPRSPPCPSRRPPGHRPRLRPLRPPLLPRFPPPHCCSARVGAGRRMQNSLRYDGDSKSLRIHAKERIPLASDSVLQAHAELDTKSGSPSYLSLMFRHFYPESPASMGMGVQFNKDEKLSYSV